MSALLLYGGLLFTGAATLASIFSFIQGGATREENEVLAQYLKRNTPHKALAKCARPFIYGFDRFFGIRFSSRRYILRSVLCTTIFMGFVLAYIYAVSTRVVQEHLLDILSAVPVYPWMFLSFLVANFLIDYISLIETRSVIGFIRNRAGCAF